MKSFKLLCVLLGVQLIIVSNASAQSLSLSPQILQQRGFEYVGERVSQRGYLQDVYRCGKQFCAEIRSEGKFFYNAVFASDFTDSNFFRPYIRKCVFMYGSVGTMEAVINGVSTSMPQLLVDRIEEVYGPYC